MPEIELIQMPSPDERSATLPAAERLLLDILDTVREPLLVLDHAFRVLHANRAFFHTFQVEPEDTIGTVLFALGDGQWDIAPLREMLRRKTRTKRGRAEVAPGRRVAPIEDPAALSRLVGDVDPHVRVNAVRSLGTYGSLANASLVYATKDSDPNVRIAAAQSFATVLSKGATDLSALWAEDTSIVYRASLLASAARAGLRPAELSSWAASSDWRLRAAVASAAGDTIDRAFAISRAVPLTRDPDARVREAAYAALSPPATMPLEDSVHAMLVSGLSDPDFYVRATVVGALADRPSVGDLGAVLAGYGQALRDSANDARLAAIQYVGALWKKDGGFLDSAWRARLAATPVPADPLERAAGKTVPVWSSWGRVAATPRPIEWYEGVVRGIVVPVLAGKTLTATINTVRGPVRLELFGADAPITVWNFLTLARSGYYRNTRFHRVVPNGWHGAFRPRHRRQPVFHYSLAAAAPRRPLHGVRQGDRRVRRIGQARPGRPDNERRSRMKWIAVLAVAGVACAPSAAAVGPPTSGVHMGIRGRRDRRPR